MTYAGVNGSRARFRARRGNRTLIQALLVTALYFICCELALGQTNGGTAGGAGATGGVVPTSNSTANPRGAAGSISGPQMYFNQPPGQADGSSASVGTLMQRSGGSLLQATLLAPPDADRAKLANVSLIAVPDPSAKTLKKHDLITIVVNENSQNSSKGDTALSKTTDFDAKLNNFILMNLSKMRMTGVAPSVAPELNFQTERDFTGTAAVDRADIVTDRITAEVIDVKPNNTVVLQARKRINTDEEKQEFIMTGVCRAEDVAADNTILSTQCYDLEIQKKNSGMVRDTTKRGFLTKMLDVIDPF